MNTINIQTTIAELTELKRAIRRVESTVTLPAELKIHAIVALLCCAFIAAEFVFILGPTQLLIESHFVWRLRVLLIGSLLMFLAGIVSLIYLVVWREARRVDEALTEYLAHNLRYLQGISFLSELFVKFAAVSLIILSGRADWVAPLCLIFIGDLLLQGKFFRLPLAVGLLGGVACFAAGAYQALYLYGTMTYPLLAMAILTIASMLNLYLLRKHV